MAWRLLELESARDVEADEIERRIVASQRIAGLADDWDGEGAEGYQQSTLDRATTLLRDFARFAHAQMHTRMGVPTIAPADHGSIDLHWSSGARELLINFPSNPEELPTYFGQNREGGTISGTLASDLLRESLVAWLALQ